MTSTHRGSVGAVTTGVRKSGRPVPCLAANVLTGAPEPGSRGRSPASTAVLPRNMPPGAAARPRLGPELRASSARMAALAASAALRDSTSFTPATSAGSSAASATLSTNGAPAISAMSRLARSLAALAASAFKTPASSLAWYASAARRDGARDALALGRAWDGIRSAGPRARPAPPHAVPSGALA
eukprot:scaffold16060_cov107-Isochrysis_galbana.AAC.6